MDALIRRFDATPDDDLMVTARGIAYQRNMGRGRVAYGKSYFEHYRSLAGSPVERALNAGRLQMLMQHAAPGAAVLDFGIGNGSFVDAAKSNGFSARGFDINPCAVEWLRKRGLYAADAIESDVVTFWDSLEHIEDPHLVLRNVRRGAVVLVAIPVMSELSKIRESKHYKPGEHLAYFTDEGFVDWMALHGFRLIDRSEHEIASGRDSIGAYAFRKDLPEWRDYIDAYSELHATRHYGSSATELHLTTAAKVVRRLGPRSILDYGCGRSDLVAHFWRDGDRVIERYDPAIPRLKRLPNQQFDLAFVCDVMEHVPMNAVDRVLGEVRSKAPAALFTISLKLARARLPDGSNAHCTLLTKSEWTRWIRDYFRAAQELPSHSEHELVLLADARADQRMAA